MIRFFTLVILIFLGHTLINDIASAADKPLNIVLVMSDDQGYGDFGATGNDVLKTPHIDAMAKRSVSMNTFYVSPVCSPTRASLMTGRYNYRTKVVDTYIGRSMMDPSEVTVAEVLKQSGYATGIFGKWHLGDCYPMRPIDQGFDEALVHLGGGLAQPSEPVENNRRYTNPILMHNGTPVNTNGYCTDVYFDAAMKYMKKQHTAGKPFFTYIATNAPHGPFHDVPEALRLEYMKQSEKLATLPVNKLNPKRRQAEIDKLARIAAMITNIDDNMGKLFKHLETIGAADNTVVIYLIDNGPNTARYVGPFRGNKAHVHEGGVRSPLWIHCPKQFKPGTSHNQTVAHIDIMPTILDLCHAKSGLPLQMDGRSFAPLLRGKSLDWPERALGIQVHRGDVPQRYHHFMLRKGDWKLLNASGFGRETLPGKPKFELYYLKDDPREQNNLASTHKEKLAEMIKAYDAWFTDVSTTRKNNYAPPRIVLGSKHELQTYLTRQDWRNGTWGANSEGHWLVTVEKKTRYDAKVIFDAAKQNETLLIKVSNAKHILEVEKNIEAGAKEVSLTGLNLPAGDFMIEASLSADKKRRGVYQVILKQRINE